MSRRTPGVRRNRPEPRHDTANRRTGALALGAVALGIALLAVAGLRTSHTPSRSDAPQEAPISSIARSCPFVPSADAEQTVGTTAVAVPAGGSGGDTSAVGLPGEKKFGSLVPDKRGSWSTADVSSGKSQAVVLRASGDSAPGTVAFGATKASGDLGGGVTIDDCPAPARDHWFVGAGSTAEHQTTVVLTNATEAPAVVDLDLHGDKGPVEAVGGDGIVVDPGSVKRVEVQDLAAGEDELAVHAVVRRGSVSVSALDASRSDGAPRGTEWVPRSASPARTQVISGVGNGDRALLVANPGSRTATVEVRMIGKDGTFAAKKLDKVEVGPGAVETAEIPSQVDDKALGVALSSDVPVTASVRTTGKGSGADVAYAAASEPVAATAAMPLDLGGLVEPSDAALMLTGPQEDDSTVTVTGYDKDGRAVGEEKVTVRAGTTVSFDPSDTSWLDGDSDSLAYLTVRPGTIPVHASAVYDTGDGISTVPLSPAPVTTPAPAAEPAP